MLFDEGEGHQKVPELDVLFLFLIPDSKGPVRNLIYVGQLNKVGFPGIQFEDLSFGGLPMGSGDELTRYLYFGFELPFVKSQAQSGKTVQVIEFPSGELLDGGVRDFHFVFLLWLLVGFDYSNSIPHLQEFVNG